MVKKKEEVKEAKEIKGNNLYKILIPALLGIIVLLLVIILVVVLKDDIKDDDKLVNNNPSYNENYDDDYYEDNNNVIDDNNQEDNNTTNNDNNNNNNTTTTKYISKDKALSIALNNAKLNKSDVYDISVELDYKYGQTVYEIDFDYNKYDYEYYINATTGKIIHHFKEID